MLLAISIVVVCLILFFLLRIRPSDLPEALPVSPTHHLDARKAAIYEGLRDLQFEYRVGKLSDADYQRTKLELQSQLAGVLAEIDKIKGDQTKPPANKQSSKRAAAAVNSGPEPAETVCPHCQAKFDWALKFCGECGKPIKEGVA
jgi:hypothetical protein